MKRFYLSPDEDAALFERYCVALEGFWELNGIEPDTREELKASWIKTRNKFKQNLVDGAECHHTIARLSRGI